MKPEEYGEKYADHFLEQYKLYVEMVDRVSQRREQSNRFYVSLVAATVALLVILARFEVADGTWPVVFLISGLFGAALSAVWFVNIISYRQLNAAKYEVINKMYEVINKMEEKLPVAGYCDEWALLRSRNRLVGSRGLSGIEQFVPVIFFVLFLMLSTYGIYLFLAK